MMRPLLRAFAILVALLVSAGSQGQVTATGGAAAAAEYRLGAGDVIRIAVFQNPDLSLETRVSDSGMVSYPLLGQIRLGQLSVGQVEKLIADGLRNGNFVKQPQVTVTVLQVRGHLVSVLGQINRPGRYPLESADIRLSDMLATAGGIIPGAGSEIVTLVGTRDGKAFRKEVDIQTMFKDAGRVDDVLMANGDVIYVDRAPSAYIYGEVQRPGPVRLERAMTLLQVLATGGGLTPRGTEKGIRVHRRGSDGKVQIIQPAMDDTVRDGDVVYVRESLF